MPVHKRKIERRLKTPKMDVDDLWRVAIGLPDFVFAYEKTLDHSDRRSIEFLSTVVEAFKHWCSFDSEEAGRDSIKWWVEQLAPIYRDLRASHDRAKSRRRIEALVHRVHKVSLDATWPAKLISIFDVSSKTIGDEGGPMECACEMVGVAFGRSQKYVRNIKSRQHSPWEPFYWYTDENRAEYSKVLLMKMFNCNEDQALKCLDILRP